MRLHRQFGTTTGSGPDELVVITPKDAGWDWSGLRVIRLETGRPLGVSTGDSEVFVLPLAGSVRVDVPDQAVSIDLAGRRSVFEGVSDFCYLGRDSEFTLTSRDGAELALPAAVCADRRPVAYGPAEAVPVEIRGAGPASRQVANFGVPGVWDHAERLIACELITPGGNWSSYPPHKHDVTRPCPVRNEEIYLYRIAGPDGVTPSREGFGLHRTYTGPEHDRAGLVPLDETLTVRDLDVVLVPYGFHGPCVAAPGYPMYYLNVLAGPGPDRSMAFCDDAAHAWLRNTWPTQPPDPRLPLR